MLAAIGNFRHSKDSFLNVNVECTLYTKVVTYTGDGFLVCWVQSSRTSSEQLECARQDIRLIELDTFMMIYLVSEQS